MTSWGRRSGNQRWHLARSLRARLGWPCLIRLRRARLLADAVFPTKLFFAGLLFAGVVPGLLAQAQNVALPARSGGAVAAALHEPPLGRQSLPPEPAHLQKAISQLTHRYPCALKLPQAAVRGRHEPRGGWPPAFKALRGFRAPPRLLWALILLLSAGVAAWTLRRPAAWPSGSLKRATFRVSLVRGIEQLSHCGGAGAPFGS